MKTKKIDEVKRKILNAFENKKIINIKICRCVKPNSYELQIGDSQNMDLVDSKGSVGLSNFYIKDILKEIEDEIRSLK